MRIRCPSQDPRTPCILRCGMGVQGAGFRVQGHVDGASVVCCRSGDGDGC